MISLNIVAMVQMQNHHLQISSEMYLTLQKASGVNLNTTIDFVGDLPAVQLLPHHSGDNPAPGNSGSTPPLFEFNKEQLATIHTCIENIQLPTHVNHPPTNLGESSHGKLKAN